MAYKSAAYRRATGKRRSYKRKSAKRRGRRPALKKMIRREISRNIENKTAQMYDYEASLSSTPSASWFSDNIFPLGPRNTFSFQIPQGVGQSSRVGNRIKTRKLMLKGSLFLDQYDAISNPNPRPLQAKCWIFYDKSAPTVVPNPKTDFFQLGGSTKPFAGDLTDMWSPVNTDKYRVLTTRTFKLGNASYQAGGGAGTTTVNNQNYTNNDFKLNCNFRINLTKYYPKDVRFVDNNTDPTTRGLYMMWAFASATGDILIQDRFMATMQYMQDYVYEDA